MSRIYIAGAHPRAKTTAFYLQYLDNKAEIVAYLYDNEEKNPKEIDGVPVIKIDGNSKLETNLPVYLGMRGVNQDKIETTLKKCGMTKILHVDADFDLRVRNVFLQKYMKAIGREFLRFYDLSADKNCYESCHTTNDVFVAKSAFDKEVSDRQINLNYEKIVQVGTEITGKIADSDYFDNVGDNISSLNKQFCELTGMYWIWKNVKSDIVGLEHYRRHFILPQNWLEIFESNGIDVILPTPLYVKPSLGQNYRERHDGKVLDSIYEYFKENNEDEYARLYDFMENNAIYSPCNMFIMKKSILDSFCEWLFPVLFYVVEKHGQLEDDYQNRYPGFLSERLMSYYFETKRDIYKIVYADKNFMR